MTVADIYDFKEYLEKLNSWYDKCNKIYEDMNFLIQSKNSIPDYVMAGPIKKITISRKINKIDKKMQKSYDEVRSRYYYVTYGLDEFPFNSIKNMNNKLDIMNFTSKNYVCGDGLDDCIENMEFITKMLQSRNNEIKNAYERIAYNEKDMHELLIQLKTTI